MQRGESRILATHAGALPRPNERCSSSSSRERLVYRRAANEQAWKSKNGDRKPIRLGRPELDLVAHSGSTSAEDCAGTGADPAFRPVTFG
jgi:hypothetical protein